MVLINNFFLAVLVIMLIYNDCSIAIIKKNIFCFVPANNLTIIITFVHKPTIKHSTS